MDEPKTIGNSKILSPVFKMVSIWTKHFYFFSRNTAYKVTKVVIHVARVDLNKCKNFLANTIHDAVMVPN